MQIGAVKALTILSPSFMRTFDNTEFGNLIYLYAPHCATAGRYNTLRASNSSSGRAVTGGKTLTMHAAIHQVGSTTAFSSVLPFYSDLDTGNDSATALTNPIYLAGEATNTIGFGGTVASSGTGAQSGLALNFTVPSGKYPGVMCNSANSSALIYALEA